MNIPPRVDAFCARCGTRVGILLAPMAGACPPSLSIAVANAGSLGACGALLMQPEAIRSWAAEMRAGSPGGFQINLWIPDPAPRRDPAHEARVRELLAAWGPEVPPTAGDATPPDFAAQCEALLDVAPCIVSSIMGLYPPEFVDRMKARGIAWFANVTTVAEARAAEAAGADVVVAQGMESGGHRGSFDAERAEVATVGLFALLPAVVDAVSLPVVATGGSADGRGVAAAGVLGASAGPSRPATSCVASGTRPARCLADLRLLGPLRRRIAGRPDFLALALGVEVGIGIPRRIDVVECFLLPLVGILLVAHRDLLAVACGCPQWVVVP